MQLQIHKLNGGSVEATGCLLNCEGVAMGWWVSEDGRTLVNVHNRIVGTITQAGRVYDQRGHFIADLVRHDQVECLKFHQPG
jgi:hypothetical protein